MAQEMLTQVLEHIGTLGLAELSQVERAVQERLETAGYSPQEWKAMQGLVKAGLLKEIKPRLTISDEERPLVPIQGKPLSETIIEERRSITLLSADTELNITAIVEGLTVENPNAHP